MNGNTSHYLDNGYPYNNNNNNNNNNNVPGLAPESFMDFFQASTLHHHHHHYPNSSSSLPLPLHDQENLYWSMNMNSYKFGYSGAESASYYGPYEVNDHLPRVDVNRRAWDYPSMVTEEDVPIADLSQHQQANEDSEALTTHEEYIGDDDQNANSPEVAWQDEVDPDNMTYEELLDLGEAVGSQSRGLSEELISMLPTSKYKCGSFFSRKKSGERCVICQMRYKRGDKQTTLPCKHVYHGECITKWLGINKICPVCNVEVFGDELES